MNGSIINPVKDGDNNGKGTTLTAARKTTVSIPQALFDRAEHLARRLNISRSHLIVLALEQFLRAYPGWEAQGAALEEHNRPAEPLPQAGSRQAIIRQGEVYWIRVDAPGSMEPGYPHPHVIIQENVINNSRVSTVVVCALTSNLTRAKSPGNVLLEVGEANLPRQSVVEVSKVSAVEKAQLGDYIGALSMERVGQILAGMHFLQSLVERRNL